MLVLTIDCSGKIFSIGVVKISKNVFKSIIFKKNNSRHFKASNLNLLINKYIFNDKDLKNKLKFISVNIGPGSYTGIRSSIALAKGISLALDIPVYGVNLMDKLHFLGLQNVNNTNILSICLFKENNYFFRFTDKFTKFPIRKKIQYLDSKEILKKIKIFKNKELVIIGENPKLVLKQLEPNLSNNVKSIDNIYEVSSSIALAKIGWIMKKMNLISSPEPYYIKIEDYFRIQ